MTVEFNVVMERATSAADRVLRTLGRGDHNVIVAPDTLFYTVRQAAVHELRLYGRHVRTNDTMLGDDMHKSTKQYIQRCIRKLMEQCGVSLDDVKEAIDEMTASSRGE